MVTFNRKTLKFTRFFRKKFAIQIKNNVLKSIKKDILNLRYENLDSPFTKTQRVLAIHTERSLKSRISNLNV